MSKKSTENKCNACDKTFKGASDLDRHLQDKHKEYECNMCNLKFTSKKQAEEHICMENEVIPQVCDKSYCQKKFISSDMLAKHVKNTHFGHQRSVCTKCGEMLDNPNNMTKHMKTCGKGYGDNKSEERREVCKHWKRGNCSWGSECNFSHVGRQEKTSPEQKSTNNARTACRNGPTCSFLARGKCSFDHHMHKVHNNREHGNTRHNDREHQGVRQDQNKGQGRKQKADRAPCRFGRDCDRVLNCPYIHNLEDFPIYNQSQGFRATKRPGNNRNRS